MIDYRLNSGAQGGLTFEFVPTRDSTYEINRYFSDRDGSDVFSMAESAFLFLEKAIADAYPECTKVIITEFATYRSKPG